MRRVVVLVGGTGIIGSSMAARAQERGLDVVSLSLDPPEASAAYSNHQIDLDKASPEALEDLLCSAAGERPVALILDILGLSDERAAVIAGFAAARDAAVGLISSCLLYDHNGTGPVDEDCPLVDIRTGTHAYLRDKAEVEFFWRRQAQVAWRIFRCNHVLGAGSLLGCIPNHNRDPHLLSRLRNGSPLALARAGDIMLSWIHPDDLANVILTVCDDPATAHLAFNANAPEPILAREYYDEIARDLGLSAPTVHDAEFSPADFWSLTARDNIFVSRHAVFRQLVFRHTLQSAIKDALSVPEDEQALRGRFLLARVKARAQR